MPHRQGGKYAGSHTTLTDLAAEVGDCAHRRREVYRISLGFIQNMGTSRGGIRSVKISDLQGCILLKVVQPGSTQEIRVYSSDPQKTKESIARYVADNRIKLMFGKPREDQLD